MKKLLILSLVSLVSACASSQQQDIEEPQTVSTQQVRYQDYDNRRIYDEDNGAYQRYNRQYRPRRHVRVVTEEVPAYDNTMVVEENYEPTYRPRRIMEDTQTTRVYNRPRYAHRRVVEDNSYNEPCTSPRDRIVNRSVNRRAETTYHYESNGNKKCPDEIRETREPVEILYKKTTYKTVYEPKTYTDVTYEKEPYRPGVDDAVVRRSSTSQPMQERTDTVIETTTTTTMH